MTTSNQNVPLQPITGGIGQPQAGGSIPVIPGHVPFSVITSPGGHTPPPYMPYVAYRQRFRATGACYPSRKEVEDYPWKFLGYRALSKWSSSSEDALLLRRFNDLNARVLLFMQDEISQIENDLEELDKANMRRSELVDNGTFRNDNEPMRNELLGLLITKLKAYNDFLLSHRQLRADQEAPTRSVKNVNNFLHDGGALKDGSKADGAVAPEEMKYLETAGDLVSLVPKVKPPLRRFLDRYAAWHRLILCGCFRVKPDKFHHYQYLYPSRTTRYHNDAHVDALMTIIVTTTGLAALIGALWILKAQGPLTSKLWTISGFLAGFTGFLSVVTVARPFEALAATAAVAAVLMVFVQLGPGGNNSCCTPN